MQPAFLFLKDRVELGADVVERGVEVVLLHGVPPPLLEPVEQALEPHAALTEGLGKPGAHQGAEGGVDVAVLEELVGKLPHDGAIVGREYLLAPIPTGIAVGGHGYPR